MFGWVKPNHTEDRDGDDDATLVPLPNLTARREDETVLIELPPVSWTMVRLATR